MLLCSLTAFSDLVTGTAIVMFGCIGFAFFLLVLFKVDFLNMVVRDFEMWFLDIPSFLILSLFAADFLDILAVLPFCLRRKFS